MKCESEDYQKCIIYHILKSDFQCKYLDSCMMMFPEKTPEFISLMQRDKIIYDFITNSIHNYCLSKKINTRCVRYKIKEEGKQPPQGLNPDGKNINIADSVHAQKIIFEEPC